ncbi:DOMON-like domain-containing protein [Thiospirillum jenense]|uniref:DOMON-like domain-containing protein n=1 Tax=Thiospirillum jenense TaxID=1653858 RepID=A0A839HF53_9GAMM|nr:DOMON-like domain-containing protein [Thiospirillum jenense]MBB1125052.1 DOMON-like domain-containing protein [Thiospirillum jenense]
MSHHRHMLHPHPQNTPPPTMAVCAMLHCASNRRWQVDFTLIDALDRVYLPPATSSQSTDGLWQSTCFEIFIGLPNTCAYIELNASPSGQWASYQFTSYRARDVAQDHQLRPYIKQRRGTARHFALQVVFTLPARLCGSDATNADSYAVGLAAVIAARDGSLSYWALHHASARPDFHHAASRVLPIATVG